ncbi:MAG: DUF29 domain-containing protein [Synechococcaceae cyanobacterium SM1_2_3]|nr:DUF29 domain-containing protein [Synechococcaceae cyanobacterium SM1_2_3]
MAYETDFYQWTQQQAALLRQGLLSDLDYENLAEEIESMGRSERHALVSHLVVILTHLLKWRYQPRLRCGSWENSIDNGRFEVDDVLEESPSLKPQLAAKIKKAYSLSRRSASRETGLPLATFPEQCPFTIEQITGDYWPD